MQNSPGTSTRTETRKPALYKVYLMNDDYTSMDFVVQVLETVFHKPQLEAASIMLHVHKMGKGLAGIYTRDIAETKVESVHKLASEKGFPLKASMEQD